MIVIAATAACPHHFLSPFLCSGVWRVTMATRCWVQVTTAVPACVLTDLAACGSLREVVTVAMTLSRPSAFATLVIKVESLLKQNQIYI